jgi:hypothetical protein
MTGKTSLGPNKNQLLCLALQNTTKKQKKGGMGERGGGKSDLGKRGFIRSDLSSSVFSPPLFRFPYPPLVLSPFPLFPRAAAAAAGQAVHFILFVCE